MTPDKINIIRTFSDAGLMVQFVLLLLLFFSITSWAIILIKFRYIRTALAESAVFIDYFSVLKAFPCSSKSKIR